MKIKPTKNFDSLFWSYNLPLQIWKGDDGSVGIIYYMPRKESCGNCCVMLSDEELKVVCDNTSLILRNLADLFEKYPNKEVDHIYYPDENLEIEKDAK